MKPCKPASPTLSFEVTSAKNAFIGRLYDGSCIHSVAEHGAENFARAKPLRPGVF